MGTPDFAVASLKKLVDEGCNIVAVITAPDKKSGRGQRVHKSAVKLYAEENNLAVLQPTNLKSPEFIKELKSFKADLQVVVAFRMLPIVVWDMPPRGTINLHASLLPAYRGAAPINWAIINGEDETGVSTFFLEHEIDTGQIILQEKCPIHPDDNAGDLHDRLMELGAEVLYKTVEQIENGSTTSSRQDFKGNEPKAPKIFKEDCQINWSDKGKRIYDFIRGLSPYPGAYTMLDGKICKIFKARFIIKSQLEQAGKVNIEDGRFQVFVPDGIIEIEVLQLAGKKRMPAEAFLNGYTVKSEKLG